MEQVTFSRWRGSSTRVPGRQYLEIRLGVPPTIMRKTLDTGMSVPTHKRWRVKRWPSTAQKIEGRKPSPLAENRSA